MTTLQVKLKLPDPLAAEAQAAGLLAPEKLERMLREALRTKRVEKLAATRDILAANPLPRDTRRDSSRNRRLSHRNSPYDWYSIPTQRSRASRGTARPAS